ncbi:hypothetical protein SAY86_014002 [Trapa natans]|uniref:Pectate lyase superfamily protein domain-containing protein n=1 Tax=Trapa natans TaxID=22666 RepID=A0AAN7KRY7_TRANT|nr:hypothetical protein SAY86_014002 [Trapa natans]
MKTQSRGNRGGGGLRGIGRSGLGGGVMSSANAATVYVPNGTYLVMAVVFEVPCWSKITVRLDGSLVAPSDYPADYRALGSHEHWILFLSVNKLRFHSRIVDGQAARFWDCRMYGRYCPSGARVH